MRDMEAALVKQIESLTKKLKALRKRLQILRLKKFGAQRRQDTKNAERLGKDLQKSNPELFKKLVAQLSKPVAAKKKPKKKASK